MPKPPNLIRPLLALAVLADGRAGRLRLRHDHRRRDPRSGPLHPEMRRLPHPGAGRHDRPDRPQPRRRLRRGSGGRRERRHDRRDRQSAGRVPAAQQRRPGRLDAARRGQRPGPRRRRRLRGHATPGSRARRRQRSRVAPAPRSSPTTAAAAATPSPRPSRAARPARTWTKSCPGQSAAMIKESIIEPQREDRQGLPRQRDAGRTSPRSSNQTKSTACRIPDRIDLERARAAEAGGRHRPLASFESKDAAAPPRPPRADHPPRLYAQVSRGRPRSALADRPHRRRRPPHRLRPRLPRLAQVLRADGAAARNPTR